MVETVKLTIEQKLYTKDPKEQMPMEPKRSVPESAYDTVDPVLNGFTPFGTDEFGITDIQQ